MNLIFLLDWHKLAMYSRKNNAPFVCNKSFRHFTIAMDDVTCAAQSIETAAWLYGIGSCYVGTILECIPAIAELYNLPMLTAPVLLLSLGYPKTMAVPRKKLDQDMVVFRGAYPALSLEKISEAYDRKYAGMRFSLPSDPHKRRALLEEFRAALRTTYNEAKCEEIVRAADKAGSIAEIQRRFGLHYHAAEMLSPDVIEGLASQEFILSTVCWSRNPNPDQQKQARPVQVKPGQRCSLRSVSRAGGLIPESRLPACFAGNKQRSACVGAILALVGLPGISAICRLRNPKMVKPLDGFFDRIGPIYRVFPIQQMSISYSGIPF